MSHTDTYFEEAERICCEIDRSQIDLLACDLSQLRVRGSRLFIIGLGGSAANASHATSDFVALCGLNAVCLSDNAAEFTAYANDYGWEESYRRMLMRRSVGSTDALLVLSVGGGTDEVSLPLVKAIDYARDKDMKVLGIVGRDGGYTKAHGDCVVVVPTVSPERVTPHTEGMQMVILHALVSHPLLQQVKTKW